MPVHDNLGLRMKSNYECASRSYLACHKPVIIRLDGKAFHTFTRGFKKPYDKLLMNCMQTTMQYLCSKVQGCVLGYTQSDEISLLLIDYKNPNTASWFEYQIQKVCSVSASMATMIFNKTFNEAVEAFSNPTSGIYRDDYDKHLQFVTKVLKEKYDVEYQSEEYMKLILAYKKSIDAGAMFDSRCFNIPVDEVCNYFYWRQSDAIRNSIQMAGQANFSHKQLQHKTCKMIQEMLKEDKGIDWNNYAIDFQRGSCCYRVITPKLAINYITGEPTGEVVDRSEWIVDHNIPIFLGENREYVEKFLNIEEKY